MMTIVSVLIARVLAGIAASANAADDRWHQRDSVGRHSLDQFFDCFLSPADPIGQAHVTSVRHPSWPCDLQHRQELPEALILPLQAIAGGTGGRRVSEEEGARVDVVERVRREVRITGEHVDPVPAGIPQPTIF
jgi:hypothetical protein